VKAHRVKCQQCANGVTTVNVWRGATAFGQADQVFVFAGRLSEEDGRSRASEAISVQENIPAAEVEDSSTFQVEVSLIRS
jgi:hypothetical protein